MEGYFGEDSSHVTISSTRLPYYTPVLIILPSALGHVCLPYVAGNSPQGLLTHKALQGSPFERHNPNSTQHLSLGMSLEKDMTAH